MTRALLLLVLGGALLLAGCAGTQDSSTPTGDEGEGSSLMDETAGQQQGGDSCPFGQGSSGQVCPTSGAADAGQQTTGGTSGSGTASTTSG